MQDPTMETRMRANQNMGHTLKRNAKLAKKRAWQKTVADMQKLN
jgi:hypothetical protein